jgi:hypothetical protein
MATDLQSVFEILGVPLPQTTVPGIPSTSLDKPKTNWQIVVGPNNSGPLYELTLARQRNLNFHVDDSASMSFTLDGDDPNLSFITELVTDAWVYRNGILIFRGRIGAATDTLDGEADSYTLQFTVFDYREWLGRQILQPSHKWHWVQQTQAQIIRDLFTYCISGQSGIHPAFTIDTSLMPTSKVNLDFVAGTSIKEALGTMPGFGWQVFPNSTMGLTLKAIPSMYYRINNNYALEYGSTVSKITRNADYSAYANSVVYNGDIKLAPVQSDAAGIANKPEGRMGLALSNPAIVDTQHLQSAATSAASLSQNVVPTYDCDLRSGMWQSSADAWVGDILPFIVKKGRLNINAKFRITDMAIQVNDDSMRGDSVSVTVAQPASIPAPY